MARTVSRPHRPRRWVRTVVVFLLGAPIIVAGGLAWLHLAGLNSPHPLVRFVQVEGESMLPTFQPGEQLLFVRRPWKIGSVVLADVGEDKAIVKRVVGFRNGRVLITGDNKAVTASYEIPPDKIVATLLIPTGVRFRPPPDTTPQQVQPQGPDGAQQIPTP